MLDLILEKSGENIKEKKNSAMDVSLDKPIKSLIKSISWRVVGTIDTMIISYFITGKLSLAVSIGGIEVVTKTILYYFHERLWAHIHRIRINILKKSDERRYEQNRTQKNTPGKINRGFIRETGHTVSRANTFYHQLWN
ncbi:MAG: DUF2061 domain-containing protein [Bacteroidales bacterium]|jgi:uncharacterized membrane protein|nr:DUF2061 domain-containing protein [Bacteroidales bacterium]